MLYTFKWICVRVRVCVCVFEYLSIWNVMERQQIDRWIYANVAEMWRYILCLYIYLTKHSVFVISHWIDTNKEVSAIVNSFFLSSCRTNTPQWHLLKTTFLFSILKSLSFDVTMTPLVYILHKMFLHLRNDITATSKKDQSRIEGS